MTAQEARAQAAAEGLELIKGTTGSGYKGVSYDPRHRSNSYKAYKPRGQFKKSSGRSHLGCFATAEEPHLLLRVQSMALTSLCLTHDATAPFELLVQGGRAARAVERAPTVTAQHATAQCTAR